MQTHARSTEPIAGGDDQRLSFSVYTMPEHAANEAARAAILQRLNVLTVANDRTLDALAAKARTALGTTMAAITLIHGYDAYLIATSGFPPGVYRRSTSLCGHAILAPDQMFVVPDTLTDERFAGNPFVAAEDGIRFYAAAQLVVDPDLVVGTLCVFDTAPRPSLSDAQELALLSLADGVMRRLHGIAAAARGAAPMQA